MDKYSFYTQRVTVALHLNISYLIILNVLGFMFETTAFVEKSDSVQFRGV